MRDDFISDSEQKLIDFISVSEHHILTYKYNPLPQHSLNSLTLTTTKIVSYSKHDLLCLLISNWARSITDHSMGGFVDKVNNTMPIELDLAIIISYTSINERTHSDVVYGTSSAAKRPQLKKQFALI